VPAHPGHIKILDNIDPVLSGQPVASLVLSVQLHVRGVPGRSLQFPLGVAGPSGSLVPVTMPLDMLPVRAEALGAARPVLPVYLPVIPRYFALGLVPGPGVLGDLAVAAGR
jgi:hypothetical protein